MASQRRIQQEYLLLSWRLYNKKGLLLSWRLYNKKGPHPVQEANLIESAKSQHLFVLLGHYWVQSKEVIFQSTLVGLTSGLQKNKKRRKKEKC